MSELHPCLVPNKQQATQLRFQLLNKHIERPTDKRILCPLSMGKSDFYFYTSELTTAHISEIMVLCCKPPFGDYANQLWDQLVLLQHKVGEVNSQIDRQKFLIESLESNLQEEIITAQESDELRLIFEARQTELSEVRNQLLEKIQSETQLYHFE